MSWYTRQNNQAAEIELLARSQQIEAAERWQNLERSTSNTGLSNSWLWIKTWLDNYDGVVQPIFAFGKQGNQLIGAALITKATQSIRGIPVPSVHLGTAGESRKETTKVQYNRLLVAPEHLNAFATGLIQALQQQFRWSELRLDGFVPEHADALVRAGANAGFHCKVDLRKSPAFDFQKAAQEGYQDVISALGNNTRYNIRRSLRLFDMNFGPRSIEWAETPEQARDILRELIHLHQKRWQRVGLPGAFQSERVRRYHEDLIDALSLWPQGSLIVFRVKQGETTIGCLFNFVEGGHVMSYKSGLALFDDNRLKPGLVAHVVCMQECKRRGLFSEEKKGGEGGKRGLLKYDFLTGERLYKEQLSNTKSDLIWITAPRGPRMWLIEKARPPFQLTRELIRSVKNGELARKATV
jgi:CelD/BcsL family acetyltransferase involved in cellulose biosynthesis